AVYWAVFYKDILLRVADTTTADTVMGIITILLLFEATRRVIGYPILLLGIFALFYCFFGALFPGFLVHRGFSLERIIRHMFLSTSGIFGIPLGVVSTFVFLFLLFGAFLKRTGVSQFFNDFANAIAGKSSGGPAKVAVVSSALNGTISGSAIANVATTGSFTIPIMKKCGYTPEFAAAVEAAASTGGQIMPPVMGAAAFLMAEFTGIPYWNIVISAAIPAVLYFTGVFFAVHIEAKRLGLKVLPDDEIKNLWSVIKHRGIFFTPVIAIVISLSSGQTPMKAALFGIIACIITGLFYKESRIGLMGFIEAFDEAAKTAIRVAVVSATAGIIVGMVTLTGLGLKMGSGLVDMAGENLIITMIFAMVSSIVLGMGVPTTANYVITSTIVAPALTMLGVPLIASHMFVFYFGIVSDITPPVCSSVYAASAIAQSDQMRTAFNAVKIAVGAFIIPYMFVLSPQLLLLNITNWLDIPRIFLGAVLGMISISAAVQGWLNSKLNIVMRLALFLGGLMLIGSGILFDIIGFSIIASIYIFNVLKQKKIIDK
ncbi:MAG TPA: TRAP transporter permease, partial [Methanosarcinales archaeon]|nr:TRAP transporter permease [Methanosarcinales archaeon]